MWFQCVLEILGVVAKTLRFCCLPALHLFRCFLCCSAFFSSVTAGVNVKFEGTQPLIANSIPAACCLWPAPSRCSGVGSLIHLGHPRLDQDSHPVGLAQRVMAFQPATVGRALSWTLMCSSWRTIPAELSEGGGFCRMVLIACRRAYSHPHRFSGYCLCVASVRIEKRRRPGFDHAFLFSNRLCYFFFSLHVFKRSERAVPTHLSAGSSSFVSPFPIRCPFLGLPSLLGAEGGKAHVFPPHVF